MGKVNRDRPLTRGTELVPNHLDALTDAKTALGNTVDTSQLETPNSTFSVSLNIPYLDSKFFYDNDPKGNAPFYMSFALPPLQDKFPADAKARRNPVTTAPDRPAPPVPVLESVSISFDQRDSGAMLVSPWYGSGKAELDGSGNATGTSHYHYTDNHGQFEPNPYEGFATYARTDERGDGYDLRLAIYSKNQTFYDLVGAGQNLTVNSIVPTYAAGANASHPRGKCDLYTTTDHNLQTGDRVFITGAYTKPDNINGEWVVTKQTATRFYIAADASGGDTNAATVSAQAVRSGGASERSFSEVLSLPIPGFTFATPAGNPILLTGQNIEFDPFKTYTIALFAPNLHDNRNVHETFPLVPKTALAVDYASGSLVDGTGLTEFRFHQHLALVSVWVTLNFKMPLEPVQRQTSDTAIQNLPQHDGATLAPTITGSAPSAGDPISADHASHGISTRIQAIDKVFEDKLHGGYAPHAKIYPTQHIKDESAYEVITVPMMQNFEFNQLTPLSWKHLPYATGQKDSYYVDRRIIPITDAITVNHVMACLSFIGSKVPTGTTHNTSYGNPFAAPLSTPRNSTSVTWSNATIPRLLNGDAIYDYHVGVGLVTGHAADNYDSQQIAYAKFDYSREGDSRFSSPLLVDAISLDLDALQDTTADTDWASADYRKLFEQALISVPMSKGAAAGAGYWANNTVNNSPTSTTEVEQYARFSQGAPVFAGGSTSKWAWDGVTGSASTYRAVIGSNNEETDAVSKTGGYEQYLEVRMAISPRLSFTISNATASNDRVTTSAAHYLKVDDVVYVHGTGRAELDDTYHLVKTVVDTTNVVLSDFSGSQIDIGGDDTGGTLVPYGQKTDIIVGYGGNFVYLICRKHLRG